MGSDDLTPGEDDQVAGLIDRLGTKGTFAAVAGLVVVVAILGSVVGSDEPPVETVMITMPPQGATTTTSPTVAEGPQVTPIDGCTLLADDDIEEALGLVADDGSFRSSGLTAFGIREACRWETVIDETGDTVALELGPGGQDDFAPDTEILGVSSVAAPGVGDLAVWYPGDGVGMMSTVEETPDGMLFVRLSIQQPELDDAARREAAANLINTAIERIRFGPPPPVEVDLCEMISDEDADRHLAPHREGRPGARDDVFGGGSPRVVDLSESGDSFCQKLILAEIYVIAAMASESDFGPDAQIDGIGGVPVGGIGDQAVWFEDVPGTGSFAAAHDADILAVRSGDAMFRIMVALPDFDPDEQFDAATELARVALSRLPGAEGGEVVLENLQTPDLSNLGFVDNLLARAEDGEWTVGDGLVATLGLFAGETDSGDVLRTDDLADASGTEVMRMARAYVEDGPDDAIRAELERLLGVLGLPTLGSPEEARDATLIASTRVPEPIIAAMSRRSFAARPLLGGALARLLQEGDDGGYAPPPDFPDKDDGGYAPPPEFPDDEPYLPPHGDPWGVGECSDASGDGWTATPAYFGETAGPYKALVIHPESGFTPGWSEEDLVWAMDAVQSSLDTFNANSSPCLHIVLSVHGGSSSYVLDTTATGVCGIFLNTPMQSWEEARFKQAIARDIAHCIIPVNWPDQFEIASYTNRRWWNGALAEFLGNAVYPAPTCSAGRCDLEWRLAPTMAVQEQTVPMMNRQDANWLFFQHLWWQGGLERVIGLVDQIPSSNEVIEHEIAMADVDGMREVFHGFIEALSDSAVQDSGGGTIAYVPPSEPIQVSGERSITRDPEPFGTKRLHITVDPGKFGCFESTTSDDVTLTYRPGSPGAAGGTWEPFPTDETVLSGEMVVVATTTQPDGTFTIEVTHVSDDGECEDEAETSDEPETPDLPCMVECGPSSYYEFFESLAGWFQDMVESMAPDTDESEAGG